MFKKETTLNAVLYITEKLGGSVDMHKVFKTLYFADMAHLGKYGRSITGDVYIAMKYGPVPAKTDDIFRAVRGDSYFAYEAQQFKPYFKFIDRYVITANKTCDLDWLSETDVECLDLAIAKCGKLDFNELTRLSHGHAWQSTEQQDEISVRDILIENGETEEYADYIEENIELDKAICG